MGAREEILSGGDSIFSPSAAAAFTLTHTIRLRASAGHGFRLPTYVDLYYSDPTTIGNPSLKPESSWSYEAGADWTPANGRLTLTATAFRLQEKNAIDYSKYSLTKPWQAINVQNFNITGAETTLRLRLHHVPTSAKLHRGPRQPAPTGSSSPSTPTTTPPRTPSSAGLDSSPTS